MATVLEKIEAKWARKAIAGFEKRWVPMVKRAETYEAFIAGIAAVTGIDESTVRGSFSAEEYRKFHEDPEPYKDIALAKIRKAAELHKWSKEYKRAFSLGS